MSAPLMMRKCSTCENEQPADWYPPRKGRTAARYGQCRKCLNAKGRVWRENNKGKTRDYKLEWERRNKEHSSKQKKDYYYAHPEIRRKSRAARYGLTPAQLDEMESRAGNVCEICGGVNTLRGHKPLQIDHCHGTGRIRGLLCHPCNVTLGHYEDGWRPGGDVAGFDSYLSRYSNKEEA